LLKRRNISGLLITHLALLLAWLIVGCTSREDPAEVLSLCGNHS
jgi:hypothetical protein